MTRHPDTPAPATKRKKWTLSAFCVGSLPEEVTQHRRGSILSARSHLPASTCNTNTSTTAFLPPRRRTVRFQDPLPCPRSLGSPHPAILTRIAFYSDSHVLRKLRLVSKSMNVIAEGILLRHLAVGHGAIRVLPPPGGTRVWVTYDEPWDASTAAQLEPNNRAKPRPNPYHEPVATTPIDPELEQQDDEPTHSLWVSGSRPRLPPAPQPEPEEEVDEEEDTGYDTASISSARGCASTGFAASLAAACVGLTLPPTTGTVYRLPIRSRLLKMARVIDVHPDADAVLIRRMLASPPPIARALPGAAGTLISPIVIVFSRARDDVPPAYPRPTITTSAARSVITHLLSATGTEALEGLVCGIESTTVLITPFVEDEDDKADDATLLDAPVLLSPTTPTSPTSPTGPNTLLSPTMLPRQAGLIEDEAGPHRLLESLAAHIAHLLPASRSSWTVVGAETWPTDWAANGSETKCGPDDVGLEDILRSLVNSKFGRWADKESVQRLKFVSHEQWRKEIGGEVYDLAIEVFE